MQISKPEKKSRAKRIRALFNRYKKWSGAYYNTTHFEEPVMFLIRRSGETEFYEKVTAGAFEFKHSNGEERFIIVNPTTQYKFGFADKKFRGYICHEDYPMTGLPDPLITAEQMNIIVEKSINDMKKWKAAEIKQWKGMVKWTLIGVAIIIGAYFLGKSLIGNPGETVTQVVNVVNSSPTVIP